MVPRVLPRGDVADVGELAPVDLRPGDRRRSRAGSRPGSPRRSASGSSCGSPRRSSSSAGCWRSGCRTTSTCPTGELPADVLHHRRDPDDRAAARRRQVSPHVVIALRANAALRGLGGFLTIFAAFLVQATFPGGWQATLALGGDRRGGRARQLRRDGGRFAPAAARPRTGSSCTRPASRRRSPCWPPSSTASRWPRWSPRVSSVTNALGKVSLDAIIQREVPDTLRASAFARSETLLQLAWVVGGALGIALPPIGWLGFTVVAALLVAHRRADRSGACTGPTRTPDRRARRADYPVERVVVSGAVLPCCCSSSSGCGGAAAAAPAARAGGRRRPEGAGAARPSTASTARGKRYTVKPPVIEVPPRRPDHPHRARRGGRARLGRAGVRRAAARTRSAWSTCPRAGGRSTGITTSDVVPPAFYLVIVENKGGAVRGVLRRLAGRLPPRRRRRRRRLSAARATQPSRSAATARSTEATLRDSARSGCRPRCRLFETSSSSLIRSSMIGTSSSGFFRLRGRDRRGHRGQRVEHAHLQRLVTAAAGDDAELHPLAGLELRRPGRQGVLVHEDVGTVLARQEAETLLRVEPLDLAGGHVGSLGSSLWIRRRGRVSSATTWIRLVAQVSSPGPATGPACFCRQPLA